MSKLKLWKPFSLFMVLLLMLSLVVVVPAPVRANVSSVTVNPYDTSIISLNTGYRITMTSGASLNAADNVTILFPADTTVPDFSGTPERVFVQDTACGTVAVAGLQVTVIIPTITPVVPGQQFTVTFNKACGIINPATSGSRTVTVWTTAEPTHVTSSYEITAVKVYTGGTTFKSQWATITAAIADASAGDTITVPAGTYNENLTVDKSLTLQGASSATVIVTAAINTVSVFTVTASNVNISGFTATGTTMIGNEGYAGIKFGSGVANCNIHDNILTGNQYGILLQDPENTTTPGNNTFTNNTASSNSVSGIEMQHSYGNTFVNNIANSNTSYGFRLDGVSHNTFTGNTANSNTKCGFSLVKGSSTGGCLYNTFTNNTANSNTEYGFREDYGDHNTLTGNTFNLNGVGRTVDAAAIRLKELVTNLTLDNNSFTNSPVGIDIATVVTDVTSWTVTHNNIAGNTIYGVKNLGTGTLNAKHNYWGHASGPSHDSPVTYGDKVSANVNFQPWLVAAYTGTPPASEITITTASPLPDGTNGVAYSTPLAASGGAGPYTWAYYSLPATRPPGLSFTGSNFSGTPTQVKADPGFDFDVQVSDGTQATYKNFLMNVYSGVPVITTTSPLPGGTKNVPYEQTLQATGGTGTYAWSVYTGALPGGLLLGPTDGKITGTPTAAGTFDFSVRVVSGSPGYKNLSITISTAGGGGQKLIGHDDAAFSGYGASNYISITKYTASMTDNMTEFRIKCNGSGHVKVAIYADSGGNPGSLLNFVGSTSVVSGWNTISFPSTAVTKDTAYWLAYISDTNNICGWVTGSEPKRYKALAFSNNFPDPAGSGYSSGTSGDMVAGWAAVTISAPTVTNSPVSNKTQTLATLNGVITSTGSENSTVIIYWGDDDGGQTANWDHSVNLGTKGAVTFFTDITGLSANTLYYYTCFAANSGGNAWATPSESFTTLALGAPTVTNSTGASSVTATSARLNGAITDTGGVNPTVIIYWGDNDGTTNTYNWDNSVNLGTKGAVPFYTDITDELTRGTKYYYRCFASNSVGPAWVASSENFTTLAGGGQKLIGHDDASFSGYGASNYISITKYIASTTDTMAEFRIKCNGSGHVKVAIYADSGGNPGSLLNFVGSTSVVSGWNTISFPSTAVTKDTAYWLAYISDTNNICGWVTGSEPKRWKTLAFSNDFPNPAGSGYSSGTGGDLVAGWGSSILPAPPAPPAIVTPKTTITFEWSAPSGATKYRLQVNTASDFTGTSMFDAEVSTTSQAVALFVGTTYYWRVKAGNTGGWGGWSATGSVTP